MRNSRKINEAMQIYTVSRGSHSSHCLLCASLFQWHAQYFLSSAFQYKTPLKRPFSFFLFAVFFFISCLDFFFPPCTHSKLLYEVMFLIKICSGNFTQSPSCCTTASGPEVWEPRESWALQRWWFSTNRAILNQFCISLSPKFCTSLRTEKQMPLL